MASKIRRLAGVLIAAAVGLTACATSSAAVPTGTAGTEPSRQSCAWPWEINVQSADTAFPDSAAFYWAQPLVAGADTRVVVSGTYPDARYASLSVYLPDGSAFTSNGVASSLPDYRIAPDPGSRNPWQRPAAPGGRFTVTISSQVTSVQTNVLPMPPGTTTQFPGYLVYRVYLPATDNPAQVPLPRLTVHDGHAVHRLPTCRDHTSTLPVLAGQPTPSSSPAPTPTPPQLKFFVPAASTFASGLANADTSYAWAYFVRPAATSDVVVVKAKAPTSPRGSHPSPWPAPGADMRYWSMCLALGAQHLPTVANPLPSGRTDYGCRADDATARNAAGDYTYVIGSESQRAAIDRIPGVTFLPFATDQTTPLYVLLLRNTLVSPAFPHSPANVTPSDPAALAAAMGQYYPTMAVCPLASVTANGCPS